MKRLRPFNEKIDVFLTVLYPWKSDKNGIPDFIACSSVLLPVQPDTTYHLDVHDQEP